MALLGGPESREMFFTLMATWQTGIGCTPAQPISAPCGLPLPLRPSAECLRGGAVNMFFGFGAAGGGYFEKLLTLLP